MKRTRNLYENQFKSKDELELIEIQYQQAIADDVIARLDINIYENFQHPEDEKTKQADVQKAQAALNRTIEQNAINLRNKQAIVETRTEQLKIREERLAELQAQFDAATIKAPESGLVVYATSMQSRRYGGSDPFDVGSDVYPNQLLMALPDTSEMVASVSVHESLAGRVHAGQKARIKVEAVDHTFTGVVQSIGVLAESGGWRDPNRREYTVKILLDEQSSADLKPSMRCDSTIVLSEARGVLAAPIEAVFTDGPVQFVYAQRRGNLTRIPIHMGKRSELYAEILAGLNEKERVLLREPKPGEITPQPWPKELLLAAGYELNDAGEPVAPWAQSGPRMLAAPKTPPTMRSGGSRSGHTRSSHPG